MEKKKRVNFIIPYIGNFPNYFQLFLNSCGKNSSFNWTILTDNEEQYRYPDNVKKVYFTWEELQKHIKSKFDFEISLESLHKLCEFKPAYGYIFEEFIEGYEFWGYCDIDVIYGDLNKFITEEMFSYDKIFTLGHLTLIRNTEYYNRMFMQSLDGIELYKKAFTSTDNYNFDEEFAGKPNINSIFEKYGAKIWKNALIADIYTKSSNFRLVKGTNVEKKKNCFFIWNNGILKRFIKDNGRFYNEEFMYIHLQKRKMKVNINQDDAMIYKIIPNSFDELEISFDNIENGFSHIKKKHFNLHYFIIRWKNLKTKLFS